MSYYSLKLFSDARVNALADRLVHLLKQKFPDDDGVLIDNTFGLTGAAAYIQQDSGTGNCNQVVFITSNEEVYRYILENISTLFKVKNIVRFKERILIDFEFVKIEIWLSETEITWVVEHDINFQESSEIPEILL